MRAIEVARFGGPDVLQVKTHPDPTPAPGQVLVRVSFSDVLFVDTLIRSGRAAKYFPIRPPYVPGNGAGGTVVSTGDGVDAAWLGRVVVAHTGGPGGGGGYAELAVADLANIAAVPSGVDLDQATAVLHDGTTALRVLEKVGIRSGEWALVLGAAGGMGILLVQLLAGRGTRVIAAAGSEAKRQLAAGAGAKATVDYSRSDWPEAVLRATAGERPAVVLDGVGGPLGAKAFELLAEGGRFSSHGSASGGFAPVDRDQAALRGIALTTIQDLQLAPQDRSRLLGAALAELDAGALEPALGPKVLLSEAAVAHHAIEARTALGKALLVPSLP